MSRLRSNFIYSGLGSGMLKLGQMLNKKHIMQDRTEASSETLFFGLGKPAESSPVDGICTKPREKA